MDDLEIIIEELKKDNSNTKLIELLLDYSQFYTIYDFIQLMSELKDELEN